MLLKKHLSLYPDDLYQRLDLASLYLEKGNLAETESLLQRVEVLIFKHDKIYNKYRLKICQAFYYELQICLLLKKRVSIKERLSFVKKLC